VVPRQKRPTYCGSQREADLANTSVTQFHILAINQGTVSHQQLLIIAIQSLRNQSSYDVMRENYGERKNRRRRKSLWLRDLKRMGMDI
jgi:hypothetical protein